VYGVGALIGGTPSFGRPIGRGSTVTGASYAASVLRWEDGPSCSVPFTVDVRDFRATSSNQLPSSVCAVADENCNVGCPLTLEDLESR
jgi:hypothetical protein